MLDLFNKEIMARRPKKKIFTSTVFNVLKRKVTRHGHITLKQRFTACYIVFLARCSKFFNVISAKVIVNTTNYQQHVLLTKQI